MTKPNERALLEGLAHKYLKDVNQFIKNLPIRYHADFESHLTKNHPPLIIAVMHGFYDIVSVLLKVFTLNLEEECDIRIKNEDIKAATALWIACFNSHLSIVKLLIHNGAQVNHATYFSSTPLKAACLGGNLDVVKYLIACGGNASVATVTNETCLMTACRQSHRKIVAILLRCNVNVNASTVTGRTALHECASSGSIRICKMLLKYGAATVADVFDTTPLMLGAMCGHSLFVKWCISRRNFSLIDKCKALVLMGCTAVDKLRDLTQGLNCWRATFSMWQNSSIKQREGFSSFLCYSNNLTSAYAFVPLARSVTDINRLSANPDLIRMQSLALRENILGGRHPNTQYYIRVRGAIYGDSEQFIRCMSLWLYALDLQQQHLCIGDASIQKSFLYFTIMFQKLILNDTAFPLHFLISVCRRILLEIDLITACQQNKYDDMKLCNSRQPVEDNYAVDRFMSIALHLIRCWLDVREANDKQRDALVTTLLNMDVNTYDAKQKFLHLAVSVDPVALQYDLRKFPCYSLVHYLVVHCHAEVNAIDRDRNLPLHLVCASAHLNPVSIDIIRLLLKHGSHFDIRNISNHTAYDEVVDEGVKDLMRKNCLPSLTCLAASALSKSGFNYERILPPSLSAFVNVH